MFREHSMETGCLSSSGTLQYRRQQAVGNHSRYPVGVPAPEQAELLEKLEQTCLRLGRPPNREELVPALRVELTAAFGSLHSALLQLGRAPSPRPTARGFHRKRWKRKKARRQTGGI
ncbi:hypothetical protein [Flavonifractor sp. An306]|uniref:hypothetical protein n=1 Tax=Eubacteriales TaxID=186802 RepID=UPI00174C29C4|nr:hypothetical protein [Flavonifractor sp. An306]